MGKELGLNEKDTETLELDKSLMEFNISNTTTEDDKLGTDDDGNLKLQALKQKDIERLEMEKSLIEIDISGPTTGCQKKHDTIDNDEKLCAYALYDTRISQEVGGDALGDLDISVPTTPKKLEVDGDNNEKLSADVENEKDAPGGSSWWEGLPRLPNDAVELILLRLPPKSIVRFRLVAKSWNTTFSDPYFCELYEARSDPSRFSLITHPPTNNLSKPVFFSSFQFDETKKSFVNPTKYQCPFESNPSYLALHGSCKGLLCVQVDSNKLCVWNPSTQECIMIPEVPNLQTSLRSSFHPPETYGFGWDPESQKFKVVYMAKDWKFEGWAVATISLGMASWTVQERTPFTFQGRPDNVVHCNGTIYWRAIQGIGNTRCFVLAGFDMKTETFKLIQPPELLAGNAEVSRKVSGAFLSQLQGSLSLLSRVKEVFNIWLLESDGGVASWALLLSINNTSPQFRSLRPLHLFGKSRVLLVGPLMDSNEWGMIWYDADSQTSISVDTLGIPRVHGAHAFTRSILFGLSKEKAKYR